MGVGLGVSWVGWDRVDWVKYAGIVHVYEILISRGTVWCEGDGSL